MRVSLMRKPGGVSLLSCCGQERIVVLVRGDRVPPSSMEDSVKGCVVFVCASCFCPPSSCLSIIFTDLLGLGKTGFLQHQISYGFDFRPVIFSFSRSFSALESSGKKVKCAKTLLIYKARISEIILNCYHSNQSCDSPFK